MDIFNPFIIEMSIQPPPRNRAPGNGNEMPDDLRAFPVVSLFGRTEAQVSRNFNQKFPDIAHHKKLILCLRLKLQSSAEVESVFQI